MSLLTVTLSMPAWIKQGMARGTYELVGGVVRRADTKQIVMWLRETGRTEQPVSHLLNILPTVGAAASVLNLSITTMGFALVLARLNGLEQRMEAAQEILQQTNDKLDLLFYANFRAALDLASNAFTMNRSENRKASAMQAINRFAEARHHYIGVVDSQLDKRSQVVDEYLSTLALAYVAEARCYLELEELDTAWHLLEQGSGVIRSRAERYVNILLTSNPAVYLHPSLKGQIDLRRLTRVFQWSNPELDENAVFEAQRENLFDLARQPRKWIESLPPAVRDARVELSSRSMNVPLLKRGITLPRTGKNFETQVIERLPVIMGTMDAMIENVDRFQMYQLEVQAPQQLGMSINEWRQLAPPDDGASGLMYIVLPESQDLEPG